MQTSRFGPGGARGAGAAPGGAARLGCPHTGLEADSGEGKHTLGLVWVLLAFIFIFIYYNLIVGSGRGVSAAEAAGLCSLTGVLVGEVQGWRRSVCSGAPAGGEASFALHV